MMRFLAYCIGGLAWLIDPKLWGIDWLYRVIVRWRTPRWTLNGRALVAGRPITANSFAEARAAFYTHYVGTANARKPMPLRCASGSGT